MFYRKAIITTLFYSGVFHVFYIFNTFFFRKFPVLLFHRVTDDYDHFTEPLSIANFDAILSFLSKYYNFIEYSTFSQLTTYKKIKPFSLITFDDATKDFRDNALPILLKNRIPCIQFIPTHHAHDGTEIWPIQLFSHEKFLDPTDAHYRAKKKLNHLMLESFEHRRKYLTEVKTINQTTVPTLTWNELRNIQSTAKQVVSFGSHSDTHEILPTLPPNELCHELSKSKLAIEKELGISPNAIAYPSGQYDSKTLEIACNYYKFGFTTDQCLAKISQLSSENGRLSIPRFLMYTTNPHEVFIRINGMQQIITYLRSCHHLIKKSGKNVRD
ncbi:MAG: polysaccharide deacetylase family protein [Candidatus Thiothrix putei]|uniref:Polysaccharide deacetylase family protein n=1 Tax=Candidatus Thiothrix putei TaxID=3080811 RepID=A0AA95HLF6_9GAMM|nr:MAG: polysaccharide deacetylase family protein [Candidatus Thiothrix putei]